MSKLPDGLPNTCIGCDDPAPIEPVQPEELEAPEGGCIGCEERSTLTWDSGRIVLEFKRDGRVTERELHKDDLDFKWKDEIELHEMLTPYFDEMAKQRDQEDQA